MTFKETSVRCWLHHWITSEQGLFLTHCCLSKRNCQVAALTPVLLLGEPQPARVASRVSSLLLTRH